MPLFLTRIELHDATLESDYQTLHDAMAMNSFQRTIKGDDGKTYKLPTAEYSKRGEYNLDEVYKSAFLAAKQTGKAFNIITSEISKTLFTLLPVVQRPPFS